MDDAASIFDRYEAVRHRLPQADPGRETVEISSLLEIADQADAFVFDAFGVLNVGDTPIAGAADRLDQLRAMGCEIRILTNAASYDRAGAVGKFRNLGLRIASEEIVTSREAALAAVGPGLWGCIAAPADTLADVPARTCRLADDRLPYRQADGFLFLSTAAWTPTRQALLQQALDERARPVLIANADLVAPRDYGLSIEPGHYGHLLADRGFGTIRFFGKPFPEVYEMLEATLPGIAPHRIMMCGDTLHTDIIGAAARGWRTALVTRDGLFSGEDTRIYCDRSELHPDWRLPRI